MIFSTELLTQTLISGLMIGVLYALMALGITFIYSIVKTINWAMGEFYMIGSYIQFLAVHAAGLGQNVSARTHGEEVGTRRDGLRAEICDFVGLQAGHGPTRRGNDEGRRLNDSVRNLQLPSPGVRVGIGRLRRERESGRRHAHLAPRCTHPLGAESRE